MSAGDGAKNRGTGQGWKGAGGPCVRAEHAGVEGRSRTSVVESMRLDDTRYAGPSPLAMTKALGRAWLGRAIVVFVFVLPFRNLLHTPCAHTIDAILTPPTPALAAASPRLLLDSAHL